MRISVKGAQDWPGWVLHADCLGETSIRADGLALLLPWWQDHRDSSTGSPQRRATAADPQSTGGFPQNIHSAVDILFGGRGAEGNAQASTRLLFS